AARLPPPSAWSACAGTTRPSAWCAMRTRATRRPGKSPRPWGSMFLSEGTVWPYRYRRGTSPLVVSMPHVGTFIPHEVGSALSDCAARRPDTDWHLPRLYDFLGDLGATVITATHSRYVVDVNRPPDGENLY